MAEDELAPERNPDFWEWIIRKDNDTRNKDSFEPLTIELEIPPKPRKDKETTEIDYSIDNSVDNTIYQF